MRRATLGFVVGLILACGGGGGADDATSSSGSSTASKACTATCDPMTGEGPHMDAAYENSYQPCLSDAVDKGITADQNHCTEKATAYCIQSCEAG